MEPAGGELAAADEICEGAGDLAAQRGVVGGGGEHGDVAGGAPLPGRISR
jgi:hypothetical protein